MMKWINSALKIVDFVRDSEKIRSKTIIVPMKIRGITTCLVLPSSCGVAVAVVVLPFSCCVTDNKGTGFGLDF